MLSRSISSDIFIRQKNVTSDLAQFLTSIRFSNTLDGETDSAEIELQDINFLFLSDWFPTRGDSVSLNLVRKNWRGNNAVDSFDLNDWEIDEIENSFPPSICKIKLNSIPTNSKMRQVDVSRSWENVSLSKIARDLAAEANLDLLFQADNDPTIDRAEQKQESGLTFLHKLAKQHGLILRVSESQLILVDELYLDSQEPVVTLRRGDQRVKSFSARATISEIYDSAQVNYSHQNGENFSASFSAGARSGQTLQINKRVSSQAEAELLAKRELRNKNKSEIKIQLSLIGDFVFLAGNVINLDDSFGFYAGNFIIERAEWSIGEGFDCRLDARKCLDY